jgi:6-phosphogluconolactonase
VPVAPELVVVQDAAAAAHCGATLIVADLQRRATDTGHATLAVSGGRTPQAMLVAIAAAALPWDRIDVLQVDERVAPPNDADRNATDQRRAFAAQLKRWPERFHWMPVEQPDLDAAAGAYARALAEAAGAPPTIDVVHLGLGSDGHTASLFPGSPLVDALGPDVAVTAEYLGRRRMTLTLPVINRARLILWTVTGADKLEALARLVAGDPELVASRVRRSGALIVADLEAAQSIP